MPRPKTDENEDYADLLDQESEYFESTSNSFTPRLELEKGEFVQIRFLPARLGDGPKKPFYARTAQHWHNMKPVGCRHHTMPQFGGEKDYECPVCKVAAKYQGSNSEKVRDAAYKAAANTTWSFFAIVKKKGDSIDDMDDVPVKKLKAYEVKLYKTIGLDLINRYRRGREKVKLAFTDPIKGYDFIYSRDRKNGKYSLQAAEDRTPAIEGMERDEMLDLVDELVDSINFRGPKFSDEQEDEWADKVASSLKRLANGRGDDDDDDDRGSRSRSRDRDGGSRGSSSRRNRDEDEDEDDNRSSRSRRDRDDEDDEDEDAKPSRSRRDRDEDPKPARSRRNRDEDEEEDDIDMTPVGSKDKDDEDDEDEDKDRGSRRSRRDRDEDEDEDGEDENDDDGDDEDEEEDEPKARRAPRTAPPAARRTPPPARRNGSSESSVDDDDDVADEKEDPAPAEKPEIEDDEHGEAPPEVEDVKGKGKRGNLASSLRDRIEKHGNNR